MHSVYTTVSRVLPDCVSVKVSINRSNLRPIVITYFSMKFANSETESNDRREQIVMTRTLLSRKSFLDVILLFGPENDVFRIYCERRRHTCISDTTYILSHCGHLYSTLPLVYNKQLLVY